VLAAAQQAFVAAENTTVMEMVDSGEGVWRCHSGFECTAVCPSNVDPAWRIMDMRRRIIGRRIKRLFGMRE